MRSKQTLETPNANELCKQVSTIASDHRAGRLCLYDFACSGFSGVGSAYVLTADDQEYETIQFDYAFELDSQTKYQLRGYRQDRRLRRRLCKPLPTSALRDEMIVVPGAGMSAEDVIGALRKMIRAVENDGLLIGQTQTGNYCTERVDALPRFVDFDNPEVAIEDT